MAMSLKLPRFAETGGRLRQRTVALASVGSFGLMLLFGTAVLVPAQLHHYSVPAKDRADKVPVRTASVDKGSPWTGGLDQHLDGKPQSNPPQPLTSASYTTGFDRTAAGLGPLPAPPQPPKLAQTSDPRACPDDLNCAFRPAKAGAVIMPAPRKLVAVAPADAAKATPQPNNFAFLTANLHWPTPSLPTPHLPLAGTLLKPFSFVGDKVADFVKKL
ncbi:MAG: hypothetical protein ACLP8A_03535 [Methylovirgula sp.]